MDRYEALTLEKEYVTTPLGSYLFHMRGEFSMIDVTLNTIIGVRTAVFVEITPTRDLEKHVIAEEILEDGHGL